MNLAFTEGSPESVCAVDRRACQPQRLRRAERPPTWTDWATIAGRWCHSVRQLFFQGHAAVSASQAATKSGRSRPTACFVHGVVARRAAAGWQQLRVRIGCGNSGSSARSLRGGAPNSRLPPHGTLEGSFSLTAPQKHWRASGNYRTQNTFRLCQLFWLIQAVSFGQTTFAAQHTLLEHPESLTIVPLQSPPTDGPARPTKSAPRPIYLLRARARCFRW